MSGCPHLPQLTAIPAEFAIDSRHIPCNGRERQNRIGSDIHTNLVEQSLRGAKALSLLRWLVLGDHGIRWKRTKPSFAIA